MKHFIFDMGGVLLKPIDYKLLANEDTHVKCTTPELETFFWNTFIEYEKGNINTEGFVDTLKPYFNKKELTAEEYEKNYFDIGVKYGGVFENAYSLLKKLKEDGYKIYLLSNLHEVSFKDFSSVFDVSIFDELFLSYKIHLIKPDYEIYQYVISKIRDNPSNMYFFDDKIENVKAAISNGMNSFLTTGETLENNINLAKSYL